VGTKNLHLVFGVFTKTGTTQQFNALSKNLPWHRVCYGKIIND